MRTKWTAVEEGVLLEAKTIEEAYRTLRAEEYKRTYAAVQGKRRKLLKENSTPKQHPFQAKFPKNVRGS